MDFYKVIENRTSNKTFKPNSVPMDKLNNIINAALMAPSWENKTCYKFIFITEQNQKNQIADTIQNKSDQTANAVKQAPLVAVIVADPAESGQVDGKPYYMVDCGIAMEHLVLAATNEGFGTCWIGAFDEQQLRNILNIPSNYRIVAMTPIGQTDEPVEHFPPKNSQQHIYYNGWEKTILQ